MVLGHKTQQSIQDWLIQNITTSLNQEDGKSMNLTSIYITNTPSILEQRIYSIENEDKIEDKKIQGISIQIKKKNRNECLSQYDEWSSEPILRSWSRILDKNLLPNAENSPKNISPQRESLPLLKRKKHYI